MPPTPCNDTRFGQRLARQYGIDAVPSLVATSRWGSELGIAHMRYEQPHLFVLPPLPAEDAFVLSVEIDPGGSRRIRSSGGAELRMGLQQEGAVHISDLSECACAYVCSPFHSMLFHLPRSTLDAFAQEMDVPRVGALRCDAGTLDPVVAALGRAMLPALMQPASASALFVDHLTLALKAHVLHAYGGGGAASAEPRGLAPWQERRAKAFLRAHLASDVSLADVARECALSRSHFSKAFKQTTGQTPHAWRVAQRVEAARGLLGQAGMPIAEIAAACGFADQSHLTRVFTAHMGTSPARWRRLNAG
uniref:helix-turn-helix domain-containing protein n=1 Tax=unclassified Variovorax TaxID=663243 RepID=UPI000D37E592